MLNRIKSIKLKYVFITAACILFQTILFFATKLVQGKPHLLSSALDDKIPFLSGFIWIYIFWYIMLLAVPYYIAMKNEDSFFRYITVYNICVIISAIIYIAYPTEVLRPNITGSSISLTITKIIYFFDTPAINCLPSIHCLLSYLFILGIFDTKEKSPLYMKLVITILSIAVVFSTFFVKQHVIVDAILALVLAICYWLVCIRFNIDKWVKEKIFKIHH